MSRHGKLLFLSLVLLSLILVAGLTGPRVATAYEPPYDANWQPTGDDPPLPGDTDSGDPEEILLRSDQLLAPRFEKVTESQVSQPSLQEDGKASIATLTPVWWMRVVLWIQGL
jgi:hypothetical protein